MAYCWRDNVHYETGRFVNFQLFMDDLKFSDEFLVCKGSWYNPTVLPVGDSTKFPPVVVTVGKAEIYGSLSPVSALQGMRLRKFYV